MFTRLLTWASLRGVAAMTLLGAMAVVGQAATIAKYDFTGSSASSSDTDAYSLASDLVDEKGTLTAGSFDTIKGNPAPSVVKLFSEILAKPGQVYFGFTITPVTGYSLDLDEITLLLGDFQKDKENPANPKVTVDVRASLNGTDFLSLGTLDLDANDGKFKSKTIDIDGTSFGEVLSAIEFRLYLLMDSSTGTNEGDGMRIDNIQLTGTVGPADGGTVVPEPTSLSLASLFGLGGVGLLCWRRRR